jgi:hypothetical protein
MASEASVEEEKDELDGIEIESICTGYTEQGTLHDALVRANRSVQDWLRQTQGGSVGCVSIVQSLVVHCPNKICHIVLEYLSVGVGWTTYRGPLTVDRQLDMLRSFVSDEDVECAGQIGNRSFLTSCKK